MRKDSHAFYFRKMPWALIWAILLSLIFQQVLRETTAFWKFCYLNGRPIMDVVLRMEAQVNMLPENDQNSRVFLLGSSSTREDFDADYLTHAFSKDHLNFYNLGIPGAISPTDAFMLKCKWLNKKPAVVIYMLDPEGFLENKCKFAKTRFFHLSVLPYLVKYLGYQLIFSNWKFFARSFFGEISLFYEYRNSFARIIGRVGTNCLTGRKITQSELFQRPPDLSRAYLLDQAEKIQKDRVSKCKTSRCSELNEALFCSFAKDLVTRGTKLIVMDAPKFPFPNLNVHDEMRCIKKWGNDFLQKQSKEIGFAYVNAESLPGLDETDFSDLTHLNGKGRATFTQFIENYLSKSLSSAAGFKGVD